MVECESFEKFKVMWMQTNIDKTKFEFDKEKVLGEFHARTGLAPGHGWVV